MSQDCKSLLMVWTIRLSMLSSAPVAAAAKESSQDSSQEQKIPLMIFCLSINLPLNKSWNQGMYLYLMALDRYFIYKFPLLAL